MSAYNKPPVNSAFVMVMDAPYIQPGMLVASGDLSEKNDWLVLSVAREIEEPRKMVIELQHVASGKCAISKLHPDDIFERKVYRQSLHVPVQPKPDLV